MISSQDERTLTAVPLADEGATAWEEVVLSLYRGATVVLRHRRRILLLILLGGALEVGLTLAKRRQYSAWATFMPQSSSDANAGLRSLAGQFGIPLAATNAAQSPDFYVELVNSPLILTRIATDSFSTIAGSPRLPFAELVRIDEKVPELQVELATAELRKRVTADVDKKTGLVTISVRTPWRPVSLAIAERILVGVNEFNLKTRQSQASAERRFTEARIAVAKDALRSAEDALQSFLERNRGLEAPRLKFDMDRLQREVSLQQQVVVTLAQALEDARLREVRDTPVITVIQTAWASVKPDPRGLVSHALLGMLAGSVLGLLLAGLSEAARAARTDGRWEVLTFQSSLRDALRGIRGVVLPRARSGP